MKKSSLTLLALSIINFCDAQDVITRNDSSQVKANIIEINPREIKYKLFNYAEGPTISSNREDVAYIVFKSGVVERYAKTRVKTTPSQSYNPNRYNLDAIPVSMYDPELKIKKCEKLYNKKNYLGFNYIAFLNTALGFNYMRDVKSY